MPHQYEEAIFAAGCFWGVQYYFDEVPGVIETEAGYTGGHVANPTYEQVCTHTTGHAEAVRIIFDPAAIISGNAEASLQQGGDEARTEPYKEYGEGALESATQLQAAFRILLRHFFRMHDPTQFNRQGPDIGDSYRSAIFYTSDEQKKAAEQIIERLNQEKFEDGIVTEVTKAGDWWRAEEYHQKYAEKTGRGMCHVPYKPL